MNSVLARCRTFLDLRAGMRTGQKIGENAITLAIILVSVAVASARTNKSMSVNTLLQPSAECARSS